MLHVQDVKITCHYVVLNEYKCISIIFLNYWKSLNKPSTNALNYKLWTSLALITSRSFTEYRDGKYHWVKSAAGIVWNVVLPIGNKSPVGLYFSGPGDRVGTVFNNIEVDTAWDGYVMYHSCK
jgi:hypothetical protein